MHRCVGVLICPICGEPLATEGRAVRCELGHAFDRAREGYVNLLPAGHGRSGLQGDAPEMLRARRRFLERGHFEPLSRAIAARATVELAGDAAAGGAAAGAPRTVVDAGCGVGYHVGRLAAALSPGPDGPTDCVLGFDVSKEAVRQAARSYPDVGFFVNDVTHRICVADGAADLLLNVLAPRNAVEFARVTRPGGTLLIAIPDDDHLSELRAKVPLLGIGEYKRDRTIGQMVEAFELVGEEAVVYARDLTADAVADFLRMTPNYWHLSQDTLAEVAGFDDLSVTVRVRLLCFRRHGPA